MHKFLHILFTLSFLSIFTMAGGNITPVEPHVDISNDNEISTMPDDSGLYAGIGYTRVRFDEKSEEHSNRGFTVQAGYDFNPYVALEARYTSSNAKDNETYNFGGDLENIALYLKPMLPITKNVALYTLLGYGKTTIDTKNGEQSESGFQWGAGVKYNLAQNLSLFWDYTQFYEGNGFDRDPGSYDILLRSVNVGLNYIY